MSIEIHGTDGYTGLMLQCRTKTGFIPNAKGEPSKEILRSEIVIKDGRENWSPFANNSFQFAYISQVKMVKVEDG